MNRWIARFRSARQLSPLFFQPSSVPLASCSPLAPRSFINPMLFTHITWPHWPHRPPLTHPYIIEHDICVILAGNDPARQLYSSNTGLVGLYFSLKLSLALSRPFNRCEFPNYLVPLKLSTFDFQFQFHSPPPLHPTPRTPNFPPASSSNPIIIRIISHITSLAKLKPSLPSPLPDFGAGPLQSPCLGLDRSTTPIHHLSRDILGELIGGTKRLWISLPSSMEERKEEQQEQEQEPTFARF